MYCKTIIGGKSLHLRKGKRQFSREQDDGSPGVLRALEPQKYLALVFRTKSGDLYGITCIFVTSFFLDYTRSSATELYVLQALDDVRSL
jgi:hypothetical protein